MAVKVVGLGDNIVDKYLHSKMMYAGGQALNFAVNAKQAGADASFLGVFGSDKHANLIKRAIRELGIEATRCRHHEGENGYAYINLVDGERIFICSNKGGALRLHPLDLDTDDLDYLSKFDLIHSDLNAYIETELDKIKELNIPFSFDFSVRGTDEYFAKVCPYLDYAFMSHGDLTEEQAKKKAEKLLRCGAKAVVATMGENGALFGDGDRWLRHKVTAVAPVDSMGVGDAFAAGLMVRLIGYARPVQSLTEDEIVAAMQAGYGLAITRLSQRGAFGIGEPFGEEDLADIDRLKSISA